MSCKTIITELWKGSEVSYTNSELVSCFFKVTNDSELWQCLCDRKIKQEQSTGISNLVDHIKNRKDHKTNYLDVLLAKRKNTLHQFVSYPAFVTKLFNWLDFILMLNLPISSVENDVMRKAVKFEKISIKSFMKYLHLLNIKLMERIAEELPEKIWDRFRWLVGWLYEPLRWNICEFLCWWCHSNSSARLSAFTKRSRLGICQLQRLDNVYFKPI